MESRDVKWDAVRQKEREILNLEEQYYLAERSSNSSVFFSNFFFSRLEKIMNEEADKMYLVLRKFSSPADCVREYFTDIENLRYHSNQVYRTNEIKLEEEKEKIDKKFRQRKNILDEEYQKLRRNYASTNE